MDSDTVRLSLILGPPDDIFHTYSPPMTRWEAQIQMRDFVENPETHRPDLWEGRPVMRALIVG